MKRSLTDHGGTKGWWFYALGLTTATLMLTSCVSQSDSGGDNGGNGEGTSNESGENSGKEDSPIATALTSATIHKEEMQVDIVSLERHQNNRVILGMKVTNKGDKDLTISDMFMAPSRNGGERYTANGISLIDYQNYKRYRPLMDQETESCLCSNWKDTVTLSQDDSLDFWVAFPSPPDSINKIGVNTNVTPDFIDVPISEAESPNKEVTEASIEDPTILDLVSRQDDLSDDSSREETGEKTSIMLSSDVLFDLNESKLTSEADEKLEAVAKEIDSSSGTTVKIDGYTDSSGNDSINLPLSEKRAESVKKKLEELVSREGVTFETAGHGSKNPVANNDTDEGRSKNRRVAITFER